MQKVRSGQHGIVDMGSMLNPEPVFVAIVDHPHGSDATHISVRSTEAGAQQRIAQVMQRWGFPPDHHVDGGVRPLPIEVP
jgi:hypothetical protein